MDAEKALISAAAAAFRNSGRSAWHFARGKLRHDPVFLALLRHGLLPERGRLLDLGCGQGILEALIAAASRQFRGGSWPSGWPPPPFGLEPLGIELSEKNVRIARSALGDSIVRHGDIRAVVFPPSAAIVMLDVLYHLDADQQLAVLRRAAAALEPDGVLLLREADASAGWSFRMTRYAEWLRSLGRGVWRPRFHYRSATAWRVLLQAVKLEVTTLAMSEGTPFANVLFIARRPAR